MKKVVTIALIVGFLVPLAGNAQTWDEWFHQKKTQKKYLLEQIAAFEEYLKDIKKGYAVVNSGVQTIKNITNGEFDLHNAFFSSLVTVNPKIRNMSLITDIIAMQATIIKKFRNASASGGSPDEAAYLSRVYQNVTNTCIEDINLLIDVLTDHALQLNDEQRARRIMDIHHSMQDKYVFAQSFTSQVSMLSFQRQKEFNDAKVTEQLYNLK